MPSRTKLSVEPLEGRELPAAVGLVNGVVNVVGDARSNTAVVSETGTTIVVQLRSATAAGGTAIVAKSYATAVVTQVRFWGYGGADALTSTVATKPVVAWGGNGRDQLTGGPGADYLYGEGGNDTLRGGGGNDTLYGGDGSDYLAGAGGNDGLYGENGVDALYGGGGADRLLQLAGEAEARDAVAADAVVRFQAGNVVWSPAEIQQIDAGLSLLQARTGNTRLLKRADGSPVTFVRKAVDADGTSVLAVNNEDGTIVIYTSTFSSAVWALETAIHEMGHNWDDPGEMNPYQPYANWLALSGWSRTRYAGGAAGDGWYYDPSAPFANGYATTNPYEDWSSSWERYFGQYFGQAWQTDYNPIGNKFAFLDAFFNRLT